jgi:hypothetical protein
MRFINEIIKYIVIGVSSFVGKTTTIVEQEGILGIGLIVFNSGIISSILHFPGDVTSVQN